LWQRLATSELLSTFFPTWLRRDKHGYWLNAPSHPVLSWYYPPQIIFQAISSYLKLDHSFILLIWSLGLHIIGSLIGWYYLFNTWSGVLPSLFGALTLTFGAYSLKQQPCIIYTLAWFPLTLYPSPLVSSLGVGMMILGGYYPFAIYLLPVSLMAHIVWYKEAWLLCGILIGLPQLVAFLKYLPKTVKRGNDKCESPEVERKFYMGIIPLLLIPFSTSRIWPLAVLSALFSLGLWKDIFPRVHERWLIVLQFAIGWMSTNALSNLNLSNKVLVILLGVHVFDLYWHNRHCLPPRPWCELYQKPSWAFNTKLTRYLDKHPGDYRVAGLPWPLFTGLVNGFKTMGYQGSMQLKLMAKWRGTSGSHGIEGLKQDDLDRYRVKYCFDRKRPDKWLPTEVRFLWRNPNI